MAIRIENDRVVRITYRLLDGEGRVLEETTPAHPYEYLHGRGQINAPVERELEGKTAGFSREINVAPRDAYGEYDPGLVVELPRSALPQEAQIEVGMKFNTKGPGGQPMIVRVIEANDRIVTVDGNHPLAGLDLVFDVRVLEVREARPEEIASGRVNASSVGTAELLDEDDDFFDPDSVH